MPNNENAVLYILWFRAPEKSSRWRKAGRFGTRAEALIAMGGKGDWRVEEVRAAEGAGPTLFDAAAEASECPR